jgi:hypothetical protein
MHTQRTLMILLPVLMVAAASGCNSSQATGGATQTAAQDLSAIPALALEARRVQFAEPTEVFVLGRAVKTSTVVEWVLTSKEPIPARAIDPVLAVGTHLVREYRYEGVTRLVFVEPEPERLVPGAEVHFQWGTSPAPSAIGQSLMVYQPSALTELKR